MIGVNITGHDAKKLKAVMDKEKLTWRSFADPGELGQGAIAARWNLAATPTLYVIDHKGVIRHKWVGSARREGHRRGPGEADQRGEGIGQNTP